MSLDDITFVSKAIWTTIVANVRDMSLSQLSYTGSAEALRDVWMAVRGSLREVLENVTIADLAAGRLPRQVRQLAERHQAERY